MKIAVALSGGVDSSVAAAVLQQQGHEVQGIFMKNWSPEDGQSLHDCPWLEDQADAEAVCMQLKIPFRAINFEREYKEHVLKYFLQEYQLGRTPNPDILCNKEIKFGVFLQAAKELGCQKMATGHYAQISKNGLLMRGIDPKKDQSYFLYTLDRSQLSQSIFPLGGMYKSEVRALASEFNLPTAVKKDSQGICFIGHLNVKTFLAEHLKQVEGTVYLVDDSAQPIGYSNQTLFYTVGERVGRLVDNRLYSRVTGSQTIPPLYVVVKSGRNLYVSPDPHHSKLYSTSLRLAAWQGAGQLAYAKGATVQVRYQQLEEVPVSALTVRADMGSTLQLGAPYVQAASPGQSAVIYLPSGEVLGGGIIEQTYDQNGS